MSRSILQYIYLLKTELLKGGSLFSIESISRFILLFPKTSVQWRIQHFTQGNYCMENLHVERKKSEPQVRKCSTYSYCSCQGPKSFHNSIQYQMQVCTNPQFIIKWGNKIKSGHYFVWKTQLYLSANGTIRYLGYIDYSYHVDQQCCRSEYLTL